MLTHTDPIDYRIFLEESTSQVVGRLTKKSRAIVLNRLSSLGLALKRFGKSQDDPFRLSRVHGVATCKIKYPAAQFLASKRNSVSDNKIGQYYSGTR